MTFTEGSIFSNFIATFTYIAGIPIGERSWDEKLWMAMAETSLTRQMRTVPPHLRDLFARIDVSLGRLIAGPEMAPKGPEGGK